MVLRMPAVQVGQISPSLRDRERNYRGVRAQNDPAASHNDPTDPIPGSRSESTATSNKLRHRPMEKACSPPFSPSSRCSRWS